MPIRGGNFSYLEVWADAIPRYPVTDRFLPRRLLNPHGFLIRPGEREPRIRLCCIGCACDLWCTVMSGFSAVECAQKATDDELRGPYWEMNFEICDVLNTDSSQVKDVMHILKKRLGTKNPRVQFLVLNMLETLTKNCVEHVILQIVQCDILHDVVEMAKKKTDLNVMEMILILMDIWKDVFGKGSGKYPEYDDACKELHVFEKKSAGVGHHTTDALNSGLYLTLHNHGVYQTTLPSSSSTQCDNSALRDIRNAQGIVCMLMEMLNSLDPCDSEGAKQEIIAYLADQCHLHQKRVVLLIRDLGKELLHEGITLKDDLQHVLKKHDDILNGKPGTCVEMATVAPFVPVNINEDESEDDAIQLIHWTTRNCRGQTKIRSIHKNGQLCDISESHSSASNGVQLLPPISPSSTFSSRRRLADPSIRCSELSCNLSSQNSKSFEEGTSSYPHDSLPSSMLSAPLKYSQRKQLSTQKQMSYIETKSVPQVERRCKDQNQRLQQETSSLQQSLHHSPTIHDQRACSLTFDAMLVQQKHYSESRSALGDESKRKNRNQILHWGKKGSSQHQSSYHSDGLDTFSLKGTGKWEDLRHHELYKKQLSYPVSKIAHSSEARGKTRNESLVQGMANSSQPQHPHQSDSQRTTLRTRHSKSDSSSKKILNELRHHELHKKQLSFPVSKIAHSSEARGKTRNESLVQGMASSSQPQHPHQSDSQHTTLRTRHSKSDSSSKKILNELVTFPKRSSSSSKS